MDGTKEETDVATEPVAQQSPVSTVDPAKPKVPLNPKDVVFGPPMPPTAVGGKKMFEKGLIHLTTTGIKDPALLAESIQKNIFGWQDASRDKPDFAPQMAVKSVQQLRKQAEQGMSPPYGNEPMAPGEGEGMRETQQEGGVEEAPPPPAKYVDYSGDKRKILEEFAQRNRDPETLKWSGVSGQNKAMLIGAVIGDLIKNKGKNLGRITTGWMTAQQRNLDVVNEKKKTADAMAMEIAKLQLDELTKRGDWENNQAGKTAQENLDAYNTRKGKGINTKNMQWGPEDAALIKSLESDGGDKTPEMKVGEAKRIAESARRKANAFMNAGDPQMAAFWHSQATYYDNWQPSGQGYKAQANKLKVEEYIPEQIRNMKSQIQKRREDTGLAKARDSARVANWNANRALKEKLFNRTFGLQEKQFNSLNRWREHAMSLADKKFEFDSTMKNKQLNLSYMKAITSGMNKTITQLSTDIKSQAGMYHSIEKMNALDFLLPDERSNMLKNAQAEMDRRIAGGEKLPKDALNLIVAQSAEYQEATLRKNNRLQEELEELDQLKREQTDAEQARQISGFLEEDLRKNVEGNVKEDVKKNGAVSLEEEKQYVTSARSGWLAKGYKADQFGPGSIPASKHKHGAALDLYPGKSGKSLDDVFNDVRENSDFNYIIYKGTAYTRRPDGSWSAKKYTGPDPHVTHVHVDYGSRAPHKSVSKRGDYAGEWLSGGKKK